MDSVLYHAKTLYLFTRSDNMTTMIPISIFGMVSAPLTSISNVPHLFLWLWVHLLHFTVSNQTLDLEEDRINKPDRPLPAGRISLRNAVILRWALMPTCWALSLAYSKEVMYASMTLCAFTTMYNELHGAWSIFSRYALNGVGFAAFEAGTTLVATNDKRSLDTAGILGIFLSGCIFATTIYAQDFRDVIGDALINRETLPLRFPKMARMGMPLGVLAWSIALCRIWGLDLYTSCAFLILSIYVGGRFIVYTTVDQDRDSYFYYNVWVIAAHALPGYWRMSH